jgi:surface polysaccharide O-acyltransferase-like enzyme
MDRNEHIFWLDATRVLAIFGVVLLHTAAPSLYKFGTIEPEEWQIANIIDAFTRPSVPLFFMVSGALLLGRSISLPQLKPKLIRLIVPLVAWSIIYLAIRATIDPNINFIRLSLGAIIVPTMYHLWFLYALIGLYLCLPLVGPVIQAASHTQLRYGLVLWVLASGVIPVFEQIAGVRSQIELSTMAGYMGYMVLGYVLVKAPRPSRKQAFLAITMIIIGYVITAAGTALATAQKGHFVGAFYGYFSPNVMLFSVGAFMIMRVMLEGRQSRLVRRLSDLSFGIYLCHVAVLMVASKVFDIGGWWIIPFSVLVFAVSAIGVFMVRRIGLAKILAP